MELKDKEAFIAQYWNQDVFKMGYSVQSRYVNSKQIEIIDNESYLELKSLEDISDEDAIKVACIMMNKSVDPKNIREDWKRVINTPDVYGIAPVNQFLRANGYLIDWTNKEGRTYTTKELLEDGTVKLKSN